jgi:hypothetical protein
MKTKQTNPIQSKSNHLLKLLTCFCLFTLPAIAQANECSSDEDCSPEEFCSILEVTTEVPCFISEDGTEECGETDEIDEYVETLGFCEERPIECQVDSDCPSHLECSFFDAVDNGMTEVVDMPVPAPPEDSGAEPADEAPESTELPEDLPPENETGMCAYFATECDSDSDCSMNFHCETQTYFVGCVAPVPADCPEDENCGFPEYNEEECQDEEETIGFCEPNEIECDSDEACPSDWRCKEIVDYSCDDDDLEVAPALPENGDEEMTDREEPSESLEISCEEVSRSLCVPVGLHSGYFGSEE